MKIEITGFAGANRKLHPKLLPDGVGVQSLNQRPGRGDLRPWHLPNPVASVPTASQALTIYRMGRDFQSDADYWLSWSTPVNVMRSFDADDTSEKTYYTGAGTPKWTNSALALASVPYPNAHRELGVPAPISPPVVTLTTDGTTGDLETRFYFSTFVNDQGDESAPSPPSNYVQCKPGALITISSLEAAPSGAYGITLRRIYVTRTGATGTADAFFLREIPIGTTTTTDDARALGEVMPSTFWVMPPSDGKWITPLWNGFASMLSGKSIRFCVPYKPYAWPIGYELVCDDTTVAQVAFDQSLIVLTTGKPYLVTGSDPSSMNAEKLKEAEACVSERSAVGMGHGVVWASRRGLMYVGSATSGNVTAGLMLTEDWAAIHPETIIAASYENWYVAFYDDGSGVRKGFIIDPLNPTGLYFLDVAYDAAYRDPISGALYVLAGGSVRKWDAAAAIMTANFKTKVFRTPMPAVMTCAQLVTDGYPVTIKVYADGNLVQTKIVTDGRPWRLPRGYLAENWQIEFSTIYPVQGMTIADDMRELM